ncbi:hypothetical protein CRG98_022390 [Punica granatum]|uniref:Retrotransposon gag domain-containing protein n=1 Tax=Punica granatum TaxID=22663 RepID=A0A2I0JLM4_PUNGR|nr:hypothetical protein CRG98_022390 [Punica granatum]
MDTRLGVVLERRLDVVVDRLPKRMGALMEARQEVDPRRGRVPNLTADLEDDEDDSYSEGNETEYDRGNCRRGQLPTVEGLRPEKFLDWLATEEEVLEFKGFPDDKQVQLVATRLRGRVTAWWPQIMYQRLQNLRQGSRSVDEYTGEFYQLITRNKLKETEDQLVARYISGLRVQLQDTINLFDPVSMSFAHHRALIVERQLKRAGNRVTSGGVAVARTGGVIRASGGSTVLVRPLKPTNIGPSSSEAKCFKYGELGHRQSECRKGEKRAMFIEED